MLPVVSFFQEPVWVTLPAQNLVQNGMHSTPELLAKDMDYLNKVLCRNSYQDWFLRKPNNRQHRDQPPTHKTTKEVFVSVPF